MKSTWTPRSMKSRNGISQEQTASKDFIIHAGWLELPLERLGLDAKQPYQVHDLLSDARYLWHGAKNYTELNPRIVPAHIFRLRRRVRTERDFDYFM